MNNRREIAKSYHRFLMNIDWKDTFYLQGIRDGKRTFLTNAFLGKFGIPKYFTGDYYSPAAVEVLKQSGRRPRGLVFEHMIPKTKYIHAPCEKQAEDGTLTVEIIETLLQKYWKVAIVTKEEDRRLGRNAMPENWDEKDIFGRYTAADVTLISRKKSLSMIGEFESLS